MPSVYMIILTATLLDVCVLNIHMESRLCDSDGGGGDADAWRQDSAARVLRALLETPKGTSARPPPFHGVGGDASRTQAHLPYTIERRR